MKQDERLFEKRICENPNLGRASIREALSQLHIEGYLGFRPHKDFTAANMSAENVNEIYDVVAASEGYATRNGHIIS